jgi:hypothetical protein
MDRENKVCICNGILNLKEEGSPSFAKIWMNLKDSITLSGAR